MQLETSYLSTPPFLMNLLYIYCEMIQEDSI